MPIYKNVDKTVVPSLTVNLDCAQGINVLDIESK